MRNRLGANGRFTPAGKGKFNGFKGNNTGGAKPGSRRATTGGNRASPVLTTSVYPGR